MNRTTGDKAWSKATIAPLGETNSAMYQTSGPFNDGALQNATAS